MLNSVTKVILTGEPEVMFVLKASALFKSVYFCTKSRPFELSQ